MKNRIVWLDEEDSITASKTWMAGTYRGVKFYEFNDDGLYYTIYFSLSNLDNDTNGISLTDYDNDILDNTDNDDYETDLDELHEKEIMEIIDKKLKKKAKKKAKRRK